MASPSTQAAAETGVPSADEGSSSSSGAPASGVPLPSSLDQLIYFNGRFLKAQDLKLEQKNYLLRIALAERAQGAGVSYGFHVSSSQQPLNPSFVDQIAQSVIAKMLRNKKDWGQVLSGASEGYGELEPELVKRLAEAVQQVCGADPGNASDTSLTLSPGHAADGHGNDLFLKSQQTVRLSQLLDAFKAKPTSCDAPGPSITPKPDTAGLGLTGAYILTAFVHGSDHGSVPVYGVQCSDKAEAACSLGYHSEGVGLQLVYFPGLTQPPAMSEPIQWRGAGARAYFAAEAKTHPSKLPQLAVFSQGAEAPDTGTHVPLGVVYLSGGNFITVDAWTAKRLRTPAELAYWLGSMLQPSKPRQVARVLQFQSQLGEALAAAASKNDPMDLWHLGFAAGPNGQALELPGVGFLPVTLDSQGSGNVPEEELKSLVGGYFAGVPFRLMAATPGQMNAIFGDALDSGPLALTRPSFNVLGRDVQQPLRELRINTQTEQTGDTGPVTQREQPQNLKSPQVFVWYPQKRQDFQGYVMFTWPIVQFGPRVTPEVHLCVDVEISPDTRGTDETAVQVRSFRFRDSEWAGVPATLSLTLGSGLFIWDALDKALGADILQKLFEFKQSAQDMFQAAVSRGPVEGAELDNPLNHILTSFKVEVAPEVLDLGVKCRAWDAFGNEVFPREEEDGAWFRSSLGFIAFSATLTGEANEPYDLRYMARYRFVQETDVEPLPYSIVFETVFQENGHVCGFNLTAPRDDPSPFVFDAIYIRVVPRGCKPPKSTDTVRPVIIPDKVKVQGTQPRPSGPAVKKPKPARR